MSFFRNKHVVTALIVAPILAVVSYYSVDLLVKEKPHAARAGSSYPLVAQSNCRYTSGRCDLKNNEFSAQVRVEEREGVERLIVESEHAVQKVTLGFSRIDNTSPSEPTSMSFNADTASWVLDTTLVLDEDTQMMIVLQANNVKYYAETPMAFSQYQTSFNKSF